MISTYLKFYHPKYLVFLLALSIIICLLRTFSFNSEDIIKIFFSSLFLSFFINIPFAYFIHKEERK